MLLSISSFSAAGLVAFANLVQARDPAIAPGAEYATVRLSFLSVLSSFSFSSSHSDFTH